MESPGKFQHIFGKILSITKILCNILFINPSYPVDFKSLLENDQKYFIIAYADNRTVYKSNKNDKNNNFLKKFSYSFGDRLKEEFHPIILQK